MSTYLCDPSGVPFDAGTFDLAEYVSGIDLRLLETSEGRRALTRLDPLLWGVLYVPHLLKGADGQITFGDVHLQVYRDSLELIRTAGPKESRRAYIAPRGSGKSTTLFLVVPLWAACHGWIKFIAAFSASATQSQDHLAGLRRELQTNKLIGLDYEDVVVPARKSNGTPVADSQSMLHTKSGFSFAARGIDTEVLGLVDPENRRPEMLLLDDIEGEESNYSALQVQKRLTTLLDGIFPMNDRAHVRMVGTVTRTGAIMHQLVKSVTETGEPERWIDDENVRTTYFPPLVKTDDGGERSLWPGRWSTEYLQSISHTRSFAKNFANTPMGADGDYWSAEDFRYPDGPLDQATHTMLSVDPAVTSKATSDYTGLAVVSWSAITKRCTVHAALQVKLPPAALRERVMAMLDEYPEVSLVVVEDNQGGDVWPHILHGLPVKLRTVHQSAPKQVRAAGVLNHYQRGRVIHARRFRDLEEQMVAFPKTPHDDVLDAVVTAVSRFLDPPKRKLTSASVQSYV